MAVPGGFTPGEPQWQADILQTLAGKGQLSGISPWAISEISNWESGYEVAGPGLNSAGYGGFFGLSPTLVYPGASGPIGTDTILSNTAASFTEQATIAAAELKSLIEGDSGNVNRALLDYTGGSQAEASSVQAAVPPGAPFWVGTGISSPTTPVGAVPQGSSAAGAVTPGLNIGLPSWLTGAVKGFFYDFGFVILGLVMIVVAFVIASHAAEGGGGGGSKSPAPRPARRDEELEEVAA